MTESSQHSCDGLAGFYSVGGLTKAEREQFEQHLETCGACVNTVTKLLPVTHKLLQVAPPLELPQGLRQRIIGTADTVSPRKKGKPVTVKSVATRRRLSAPYQIVAIVFLIVAGALGWYAASQVTRSQELRANLEATTLQIEVANLDAATARQTTTEMRGFAEILVATDVTSIDLQGQPDAPDASGRVFFSETEGILIVASNLPPLPPGQIYQIWFVVPPNPIGVGFARVDAEGRAFVKIEPTDSQLPIAVALTLETEGGVAEPSGAVYLLGRTDQ
tara:strand:+ start:14732 stop:15559 length:828 start_codon:yes stop_codon:yes gene_type:complete